MKALKKKVDEELELLVEVTQLEKEAVIHCDKADGSRTGKKLGELLLVRIMSCKMLSCPNPLSATTIMLLLLSTLLPSPNNPHTPLCILVSCI